MQIYYSFFMCAVGACENVVCVRLLDIRDRNTGAFFQYRCSVLIFF